MDSVYLSLEMLYTIHNFRLVILYKILIICPKCI